MAEDIIVLGAKKKRTLMDEVKTLLPDGGNLNLCLTCGACSSGCPATGLEGLDPRKFLRMAALGMDFISAIGSVAANITNEGPGFGCVAADYAGVPLLGKWVLIFCMLAGRLEIFSVFLLLLPLTWKK